MKEMFFSLLSPYMPETLSEQLTFLYNGAIICIGAGVILLLISAVLVITALRRRKRAQSI